MQWDADAYFKAAQEHLDEALSLFTSESDKRYLYAHYWPGISVECMLRAYQMRYVKEWVGRHDLSELFEKGYEKAISVRSAGKTSEILNDVTRRWNSNHRYATSEMLIASLRDKKIDVHLKGDLLKNNARCMLEYTQRIVTSGVEHWR